MESGSEKIAAFQPLCNKLARRLNGLGGAEYDDLNQEGLICVWDCFRKGFSPTALHVEYRMRNWIRFCRRKGFSGYDQKEA